MFFLLFFFSIARLELFLVSIVHMHDFFQGLRTRPTTKRENKFCLRMKNKSVQIISVPLKKNLLICRHNQKWIKWNWIGTGVYILTKSNTHTHIYTVRNHLSVKQFFSFLFSLLFWPNSTFMHETWTSRKRDENLVYKTIDRNTNVTFLENIYSGD